MKKLAALLVSAILTVGLLPAASAAGFASARTVSVTLLIARSFAMF